jgi:hypothetical protein
LTDLIPPGLSQPPQPSHDGPPSAVTPGFDPGSGPVVTCRYCHNTPAVQTTFRQHTGMIILMKFGKIEGPFCRNCGLSAFRSTTGHTLLAGWWGWISIFVAPITILMNVIRRNKVAKLPPPVIGPEGLTPADPGKPLYRRPVILGLLLPVLVAGFFTAVIISDQVENQVGKCVTVAANQVDIQFIDCDLRHDGVITQVVDRADQCPADSLGAVSRETSSGLNRDGGKVLCIGPSQ